MRFVRYRTPDGLVFWRYLTANHRIVAVSPQGFDSVEQAAVAIHRIRRHAAAAPIAFSSNRGGMWMWAMSVEDTVIAASAHPYGRRRAAEVAADRFQRMAPSSSLVEWVAERGAQRPRRQPSVLEA